MIARFPSGWTLLFCLFGVGMNVCVYAQQDSLPSFTPRPDSNVLNPFLYGDSTELLGLPSGKPSLKVRAREAWLAIRPSVPHTYQDVDTVKLSLRAPWREDSFSVAVPKVFLATGTPPPYDPQVAWQRSFLIPGWGQAYNRSLWKVPLFYVGYVGIYGWITFNQQQYLRYRAAFICAELNEVGCTIPDDISNVGDDRGIRTRRDNFRNARDQGFLILAGWHVLQVAEAYVNAHLKDFDVSKDLTFRAGPQPMQVGAARGMGLGLQLSW